MCIKLAFGAIDPNRQLPILPQLIALVNCYCTRHHRTHPPRTHLLRKMQRKPTQHNIPRLQPRIHQPTSQSIRVIIHMLQRPLDILVFVSDHLHVGVVCGQAGQGVAGADGRHGATCDGCGAAGGAGASSNGGGSK